MPRMTLMEKIQQPMTLKYANELAFKWLSLHSRHPDYCKRTQSRIMPETAYNDGLSKNYGGRYATEEEIVKVACTCGLDEVLKALCQTSLPNDS